ncbi:MAG: DnaJ domain-containing protein [Anaerolineales bacterium]|nr:DnaJ domain-containing protein [Anaerolineales bacterium]
MTHKNNEPIDHYEVLGVTTSATSDEIRRRYRFLVMAFHPDKFSRSDEFHGLAEFHVKQVNESYRVLSDPQRRTEYDTARRLLMGQKASGARPAVTATQRELEEAHNRTHALERELRQVRQQLDALDKDRAALQRILTEREQTWLVEKQALNADQQVSALKLDQATRERQSGEQLLRHQLEQAKLRIDALQEEVASRERLVETLSLSKAEWEQSQKARLTTLEKQVQRLKRDLGTRNALIAQQENHEKSLEDRLNLLAHDAQQLSTAVVDLQREAEQWHAQADVRMMAYQRQQMQVRLWQIAAVIGIANTILLLWFVFAR